MSMKKSLIALAAALTIALSTVFPALAQGKTARAAAARSARNRVRCHSDKRLGSCRMAAVLCT